MKGKFYTDGSCSFNPGPGGWSAVNISNLECIKTISGHEPNTTNNRMEILSVIKCLQIWKKYDIIEIYSDSKYVIDCFNNWQRIWHIKDKSEVKNLDLWDILFEEAKGRDIKFFKVKGHSKNYFNDIADKLAVAMSKRRNHS